MSNDKKKWDSVAMKVDFTNRLLADFDFNECIREMELSPTMDYTLQVLFHDARVTIDVRRNKHGL